MQSFNRFTCWISGLCVGLLYSNHPVVAGWIGGLAAAGHALGMLAEALLKRRLTLRLTQRRASR